MFEPRPEMSTATRLRAVLFAAPCGSDSPIGKSCIASTRPGLPSGTIQWLVRPCGASLGNRARAWLSPVGRLTGDRLESSEPYNHWAYAAGAGHRLGDHLG